MRLGDEIIDMYPDSIDNTNFRYIKIDNMYLASILIRNYPKYSSFLEIMDSFPKKFEYSMSIYVRKQDNMKILKELTYQISSFGGEINTMSKNQIDIDVIKTVKEDALALRREIQVNEQEIFFVNIYFTFSSSDKNILFDKIREIQSIFYSRGIISSIANFRHLDTYLLNLPLNKNKEKILELNERCFTTNAISNIFPFYTKTIFDKNGIIFGFTSDENKICNIDIFDKKYINSNMCILGSSGSGKSYFTKLMVIRHFLSGKNQYIIDPQGEYVSIAKNLNYHYFSFTENNPKWYINPFQIWDYEIFIHGDNVIEYKVELLKNMICILCGITDNENIFSLKKIVRKVYNSFNIKTVEDVYNKSSKSKIYVDKKIIAATKFPTFIHLLKYINKSSLKNNIRTNIINKFKLFSLHTNIYENCFENNIDYNSLNKLHVFDTSNLDGKIEKYIVSEILKNIMWNLKYIQSKEKSGVSNCTASTIIYIDEIWKYVKKDESYINEKNDFEDNCKLGIKIFELFKTIRKYNAAIIAITQDISDFFLLEDGSFGKSIINNSNFKIFFKLDFSDSEFLEKYYILPKDEVYKVNRLSKGQAVMCFKNVNIGINVKSNKYEAEILEEKKNENYSSFK